jgi:uncharacterized membrane protein YgcG
MKRLLALSAVILIVFSLALPILGGAFDSAVYADDFDMDTLRYDVDITVNEDNTFDVKESIVVNFIGESHGIMRDIPYRGTAISMVDGQEVQQDYRIKITEISVPGYEYETSKEDGNIVLKIGSPDETIRGEHAYIIAYKMILNDDETVDYDSVYLNVIPQKWDDVIDSATVAIHFPKSDGLGNSEFIGSTDGAADTGVMVEETSERSDGGIDIIATTIRPIASGEGITFRALLDEGYFVGEATKADYAWILWIFIVVCPVAIVVLWFAFGRDDPVIQTVEFYPPEDLTPAEIGFLWDGKTDNRDLSAMFVYWAEKGYLSIEKISEDDLMLRKLCDLPPSAKIFEKTMFDGIFSAGNSVSTDSLGQAHFGASISSAKKLLEVPYKEKGQPQRLHTKNSLTAKKVGYSLSILPLVAFILIGWQDNLEVSTIVPMVGVILFGSRIVTALMKSIKGITIGAVSIIVIIVLIMQVSSMFLSSGMLLELSSVVRENLFVIIMLAISTLISLTFATLSKKKSAYYTEVLGKIRGFRDFIKAAEADRIRLLAEENPKYFFNVLPYAWAMGVSDVWAEHFKSLKVPDPDWATGHNANFMGSSLYYVAMMSSYSHMVERQIARAAVQNTATTTNSSAASRFSSFGGFSGGGFGGGGGGRW